MILSEKEAVLEFKNYDLDAIVTPINTERLKELLDKFKYDKHKTEFLVDGFTNGFDIGYSGPIKRRSRSKNLPFSIGSPLELWNKVMKEVEVKRYVGPYDTIPFENFIQSPIGLVPKDGGKKTRLIFHLSYDFGENKDQRSLNHHMPKELCMVKYKDLDQAMSYSLRIARCFPKIFYSKTDL